MSIVVAIVIYLLFRISVTVTIFSKFTFFKYYHHLRLFFILAYLEIVGAGLLLLFALLLLLIAGIVFYSINFDFSSYFKDYLAIFSCFILIFKCARKKRTNFLTLILSKSTKIVKNTKDSN